MSSGFDLRDEFRAISCGIISLLDGHWYCDSGVISFEGEVEGSGHGLNKCTKSSNIDHLDAFKMVRINGSGEGNGKGYGMGKQMLIAKDRKMMLRHRHLLLIIPYEIKLIDDIGEVHK